MKEELFDSIDNFKSIKIPLKKIVRYDSVVIKLSETANMANKIVIHSLQFI